MRVDLSKGTYFIVFVNANMGQNMFSCKFYRIPLFRGCHRQPLYYFHFDFQYIMLDIYIYIICDPMRNGNNEFILIIYIAQLKMVNFERCKLEIGLEFGHISFDKRKNFSEGSSNLT